MPVFIAVFLDVLLKSHYISLHDFLKRLPRFVFIWRFSVFRRVLKSMFFTVESSANKIVNTKGQLDVLIRLSKSTGYEEVRVEASRVLALVVKHGNSQGKQQKIKKHYRTV